MSGKLEVLKMGEGEDHHQKNNTPEKELMREGGSLEYWNDYKMDNEGVQDAWKVRPVTCSGLPRLDFIIGVFFAAKKLKTLSC